MNHIFASREIVDIFLKRLSKWKIEMFLYVGRLILIKFVLGSIGIYYMSLFKIPTKVCSMLETVLSKFF